MEEEGDLKINMGFVYAQTPYEECDIIYYKQ